VYEPMRGPIKYIPNARSYSTAMVENVWGWASVAEQFLHFVLNQHVSIRRVKILCIDSAWQKFALYIFGHKEPNISTKKISTWRKRQSTQCSEAD